MPTSVADLTLDELTALIEHVVDTRLTQPLTPLYIVPIPDDPDTFLEKLRAARLPTPDGVPTPSEMIAEERAQWRSSTS